MGKHIVTGAFGFSGRYIAARLLNAGHEVLTLTNSPDRPNPFEGRVKAMPFNFGHPDQLAKSLEGADVLYNTYWVRFNHPSFTHAEATANTLQLFTAAEAAGVRRIVHVSIANADSASHLEYFRDKGMLEEALEQSGISYSILRPAVLFGPEDILINNIAWTIRRFPVFCVFGDGRYHLQPIFVDDLAKLAVEQGELTENTVVEAIGPETFSYTELVLTLMGIIGKRRLIVHVPPWAGWWLSLLVGRFVDDIFVTREEIQGLMEDRLHVDAPPAGQTKLTEWAREQGDRIGLDYHSEMARRRDRKLDYAAGMKSRPST